MRKRLIKLLKTTVKLVVFAGLVYGGYFAYTTYYSPAEEEDTLGALPTAVAEVRDIVVSVSATGVLQPVRIVEVKSKASGEILNMPVEMGDLVERGQLIAQVDTRILTQELKQSEADHQSADTRLKIAQRQYVRAQDLHKQDLISENDLETSEQNFTNAEAQLLRAEATLQLAVERLEDATVTAPITGRIIAKTVEEGQIITSSMSNVSGGTTLVQMADLSELEIRTLVDEVDIGTVRAGLEVESKVEAFPDQEFLGEVMKIEPQAVVQQSVTTFPVLSRIDNGQGLLLPGMNADVNIVVYRRPNVLAIRNEAVRTPDDARQVADILGLGAVNEEASQMLAAEAGGDHAEVRPGGDNGADQSGDRAGAPGSSNGTSSPARPGSPAASGSDHSGSNGGSNGGQSSSRGGSDGGQGSSGMRGSGGGSGGGRGMDMSDPAARQRMMEMMQRRREEQEAAARDPWGTAGGRREPAVVFVMSADGVLTQRDIMTGVRDWEYTEVLEGLVAGDEVVMLPSTSLLTSQDDLRARFAGRSMIPGMGGGGGRSRGGGAPH
jgi:HlyD family secretion protein